MVLKKCLLMQSKTSLSHLKSQLRLWIHQAAVIRKRHAKFVAQSQLTPLIIRIVPTASVSAALPLIPRQELSRRFPNVGERSERVS